MTTFLLTRSELEELEQQLSVRARLWFRARDRWIRHTHSGVNRYALFVQSTSLRLELIHPCEIGPAVELEVHDLLDKFSSYGWRKRVEEYLKQFGVQDPTVAQRICDPDGLSSPAKLVVPPAVEERRLEERRTTERRSTYLKHLLGK